jgi:cytochrome c-type biogenesis protein CcmH
VRAIVLGLLFLTAVLCLDACRRAPPDETISLRASVLSNEIMSPFCPGLTLAACPSEAAAQLRREVAERLARGEGPEAIIETLVGRFGEGIRGTPRVDGVGITLWLVPAVLGLAMLKGLAAAGGLRRRAPASPDCPASTDADGSLQVRLEDELQGLD